MSETIHTTAEATSQADTPSTPGARADLERAQARIEQLTQALRLAEAALADIGDADREPGDDLAWCEDRAAQALPKVRAAISSWAQTP